MPTLVLEDRRSFTARALLLGLRIDSRSLELDRAIATAPTTLPIREGGLAVVFRFGAVVLVGVSPAAETQFLQSLRPLVHSPYERPDSEEIAIEVDPAAGDAVAPDKVILADHAVERLQIVADVLAKSVLLARYESEILSAFDRVEPIAATLERTGRTGRSSRDLLRHIGAGLLSEQRLVGRASVVEKPDLLWDNAHLERFDVRLAEEFDLPERHATLQHKQELISRTAQTVLDVLQTQRALRVELAVVALIAIEIGLTLYELFFRNR
jgi:uncharacterized Rmd1/YagE family protein